MTSPLISTHDLTKTFATRIAVDGKRRKQRSTLTAVDAVNLTLSPGESLGYIGANGAGKSTTIKMLLGILKPTSGEVRTHGHDPMKQRKLIARTTGVVFGQRSQLWWDLPVRESFRILAAIHRVPLADANARTDELVERLDLGAFWDTPVRKLSLGQRMRAEIASAMLHRPSLLILDEPTIGLDVLSKQQLRDFLLAERADHGTALLLTTHDLGDIQQLCPRVLLVDAGRIAYDGDLTGLASLAKAHRSVQVEFASTGVDCAGIPHAQVITSEGHGIRQEIGYDGDLTTAARVMAEVFTRGEVVDVTLNEPDIEDVVRQVYRENAGA